jgi:nicotinate-nucleotide pyrophosphorylase (carboxylating)
MKTTNQLIDDLLELAFAEDIGDGDHTTLSTIPSDAMGRSRLIIKEDGILAGVDMARKVFEKLDPSIKMEVMIEDGAKVKKGDIVFTAEGPIRSLLIAERTMLNIMQRMSGVATMTRRYQDELEGLNTKVLDTRKTTPGMRLLEKEAVKIGGGTNHRIGLFDMILIKDNHIDFAGGIEKAIDRANDYCKQNGKNLKIEVEVRSLDDIRRVMEHGGVNRIMFDNFTPELTKEAVKMVDGKYETESSGGITLENLRSYGEAGVDFISVGALTHSVKGLDMSFKAF